MKRKFSTMNYKILKEILGKLQINNFNRVYCRFPPLI